MKAIGIKYQLRFATLLPVLLVALLFAFFYNRQFNQDQERHIAHLGKAYIHQLLPVAQVALLKHDKRILQGLVDASTVNSDVQALAFYDAHHRLLAYRGDKNSLPQMFNPPKITSDRPEKRQINPYTINFLSPITLPEYNVYGSSSHTYLQNPLTLKADEVLGWLSLNIDTKGMLIKHYQMLIITFFITLLGLSLSLSIHHALSKRIYLPLTRLRRSMKQILSNEFETNIPISKDNELGIIAKGCAHLQKKYLDTLCDLNQHIEVATADLQHSLELVEEKNIELTLEKKKTEEKSRQKSELIANMSHEIRTPMNGVIGFTNVLLDSKLDPLQLDYVKTIKSSAVDLLGIINDILDYSKIDAGKLHLDCIPLDIRSSIDDVLALIAPIAHKKGIDLIPSTDIDVPKLMLGDPLRIKQILNNLVSNAVKFTDHGYVLIRTTLAKESEKDYALSISITDTGIGISPEDQAILFTAFNQADKSISRRYGGSGLGLVICKKLAEQMQGRISLTSELYKGSTFTIHLKLEKFAAYEVEKKQTHRFANLKVICFDDNPLQLETLCNGLRFWGIHCERANTPHQLEMAYKNFPNHHLAFVGVNPECSLEQIKQLLQPKTVPTVLISKWPIQNYEDLGAQGFLFKPPNMQKLHDTIDSLQNEVALTKNNHPELENLRTQLRIAQPHLLVAEDNPVNQLLLNSMLGEKTYIETVDDGKQAVAICSHQHFNAILLDLQMPILNGLEAAILIHRESILNKNTPIILISANSFDISQEQLKKAGISLCLQKPIDETMLLKELLRLLTKSKPLAIHWDQCLQKVSGNQGLAKEFLVRFVEELNKNRAQFLSLWESCDRKAIESLAHRLLGACCFCGVPMLERAVAQVEKNALKAPINELYPLFRTMMQCIDDVLQTYERHYQKISA